MLNESHRRNDDDIARYEVSEDGVSWRPYDAKRDKDRRLHKRIEFAAPSDECAYA